MQRYFRLQNLHEFLAFLLAELKRIPLVGCNASSPQLRCFWPLLHHRQSPVEMEVVKDQATQAVACKEGTRLHKFSTTYAWVT